MLRFAVLCALIPLAFSALDYEFVNEDPTNQEAVQVVHFKQPYSSNYYGYNNIGMGTPYGSRFYNPQMYNTMGMGMSGMGMGMAGGRLEEFFRTFLSWLTPYQKSELRQMRSIGSSREMMVRRVMDFFDMLPMMGERRNRATIMMRAACHKVAENVFGQVQAMNLKRMIDDAAMSPRPYTGIQEIREMMEEMISQVDEYPKQRMINMYGPLCKKVAYSYIQQYQQYPSQISKRMTTMGGSMMMPSSSQQQQQQYPSSYTSTSYFPFSFPSSLTSLYNTIQAMPFQNAGKYFSNRFPFMKSIFYSTPSGNGMMSASSSSEQQQQQQMESEQQQQMSSSSVTFPMGAASSSEEQQQQEMMSASSNSEQQMQQQQQQQKTTMMTGTSGIDSAMMGMSPTGTSGMMMSPYYKPKQQQQEMQQQQQQLGQQQQMGQKGMQQQQQQQPKQQMVAIPENTGIFPSYYNNELLW